MNPRVAWIHGASLASTQAIQLVVALMLARWLSPHELGLFAMAAAPIGLAHVVRDLGVSVYLQREQRLDEGKVRAALGLSCATGIALYVAMAAAAPGLEAATGEAGLTPLLRLMALGLLIVPVGAVMTALALREGHAARLAWVTACGNLSQAAVAVGLALTGAGAAAPAWAHLTNLAVCSLIVWPLRPRALWGWPRLRGWQPILRVGRSTLPAGALAAAQGAAPALLLGALSGATAVGLLGRAQSLTALIPGMAGLALQFGTLGRWARAHHRGRRLAVAVTAHARRVSTIAWPALAITTALAQPLTLVLFGPAWIEAVPAVIPLAMLAALAAPFTGTAAAMGAMGRPGRAALPQGLALATGLALAALLVLPQGPAGAARFAWWLLIAGVAALPCQLWLYRHGLGLRAARLAGALVEAALVAGGVGAAAWLGTHLVRPDTSQNDPSCAPERLVAGVALALPLWWLARRRRPQAEASRSPWARLRITIRK